MQLRRQVIVGSHIVDFMALAAGLVVEVDGDGYHAIRSAADRSLDAMLRRAGYVVLRLPASMVAQRLDDAVALVWGALGRRIVLARGRGSRHSRCGVSLRQLSLRVMTGTWLFVGKSAARCWAAGSRDNW